jgi:hypothetical protein
MAWNYLIIDEFVGLVPPNPFSRFRGASHDLHLILGIFRLMKIKDLRIGRIRQIGALHSK